MSNLAQKLLKSGFLMEATELCDRAIKITDYHQNVGHAIGKIKAVPIEEERKEKEVLDKAKPLSEFYREYGRAIAQDNVTDIAGRWRGPDCELQITIKGNMFMADGNYETSSSGLRLMGGAFGQTSLPPTTEKHRVSYTGKICGHSVDSTVSRKEVTNSFASSTFLTDMLNQKRAIMIISETINEIRVGEKDSSDKFSFYMLTRLD